MADDTLRQRIEAELAQREAGLPALYRLPGVVVGVDACTCYGGTLPEGQEPGCGTEPGPLWFVLAELGRFYAAARRVLDRHRPILWESLTGERRCARCGDTLDCPEIADLAASLGLSTTTSEEQQP